MKCPHCHHPKSGVVETRALANTIWRRRSCHDCGKSWVTQESRADRMPLGIHAATRQAQKPRVLFRPMRGGALPAVLFPVEREGGDT